MGETFCLAAILPGAQKRAIYGFVPVKHRVRLVDTRWIFSHSPRRGRLVTPHYTGAKVPAMVRKAREASLASKGAKIFNLLPAYIRNINLGNVKTFEKEKDFFSQIGPRPTHNSWTPKGS